MKRIIDYYLLEWKASPSRKPLLLRGARQIGKTYAARELGKTYESFVEINLERNIQVHKAFLGNLNPKEIIISLSSALEQKIIPGKTLLFIDEIQACPQAIIALRYFYEELSELHVIAAGSLLDFAIQQVGAPVGRIQALYMHPISFIEYLANFHPLIARLIIDHQPSQAIGQLTHEKCLQLLSRYVVIGGMPEAMQSWADNQDPLEISIIHTAILDFYRQDFNKYAKNHELKYVEKIFKNIPQQLGQKFKYTLIEGDYRKRELSPALDLLITAGIAHKVYYSAGQGIPLGGQQDNTDYKVIFLDTGLAQTTLKLNIAQWFLEPLQEFINKGALTEALVGQELAAYADPRIENDLYYWHKDKNGNQAEIDYLIEINNQIIPIEVKSGDGRTLKSIHRFLESHLGSPYGIKFSIQDYSIHEKIHSYPLYAIAQVMNNQQTSIKNAITSLVSEAIIIPYDIRMNFGAVGNQADEIIQQLIIKTPFQEKVVIIDYRDDGYPPTRDQTIAGLQGIFSENNSRINQLCAQHKNLRILKFMYHNIIIWQTTIKNYLLNHNE